MDRLVMLMPIAPAATGNGLAMRAELFCRAAAVAFDLQVIVVPVAGRSPAAAARPTLEVGLDAGAARTGIVSLLAQPAWRRRLAQSDPLPALARAASPGLAGAVAAFVPPADRVAVHVMRSYLAPLGLAVAERIGAARATLDLDEDDATLAAAGGDQVAAAAYDRLLASFGPSFARVAIASEPEAAAIAQRHDLHPVVIPNAVPMPRAVSTAPGPRGALSLLFVGNLTYEPNCEAARILVDTILPETRRRLGGALRLALVGPHGPELERLAGPEVAVTGFVPELGPLYAAADVVVVPLRAGAGTRIKLLEAFAHGVPVVASPVAAAGLGAVDGRHLLLASDAAQFAVAIARLAADPALGNRLAAEARALVAERYAIEAVAPSVHAFLAASQYDAAVARKGTASS